METKFMTVAEAARTLGYRQHYVRELIWEGKLFADKVDRQWQIPAEAVKEFMAKKEPTNA